MTSSLEQIESLRIKLTERVSELNGDFLHESVLEISRQLDDLILKYLKSVNSNESNPIPFGNEPQKLPSTKYGK